MIYKYIITVYIVSYGVESILTKAIKAKPIGAKNFQFLPVIAS